MGSEAIEFPTSTSYTDAGNNIYTQESVMLDRYRQGIKVIFRPHGSIGKIDAFKIIDMIIQGVVLLGVASTLTTIIATNPYLASFIDLESFSQIFARYYAVAIEGKGDAVTAKTAAKAATQASQFFRTFDPQMTGETPNKSTV